MKYLVVGAESQAEGLVVRGRTHERNHSGNMIGRLKSKNEDKLCYFCKRKWYIRADCFQLQNKNMMATANQKGKQPENLGEASVVEGKRVIESFL